MKYINFLLIGLICVGCAITQPSATYHVSLDKVERPKDASNRYGDYKIKEAEVDTVDGTEYVYQDSLLRAAWLIGGDYIYATITNKTENTFKIIWNESAFVTPNGQSMGLAHGEVKLNEANQSIPPTIVAPRTHVNKFIYPSNLFTWNDYGGYWNQDPILSPVSITNSKSRKKAKSHIGEKLRIILPIEIESNVHEYRFHFKVDSVNLPEKAENRRHNNQY